MGSGFSLGTKDPPGVWVMLGVMEGRRCQWVTAVSTASPLTRDARTCPLGKHLAGSSVAIVRNSGKKQQILKLRPTLKKKFLPTFYLFFFFLFLLSRSSTSQSTLCFQLRHPRGSGFEGRAEPGAGELLYPSLGSGHAGRAGGRTPLTWAVPQVRAGISLLRSIPGGTADPAGNCVVAAAGLT